MEHYKISEKKSFHRDTYEEIYLVKKTNQSVRNKINNLDLVTKFSKLIQSCGKDTIWNEDEVSMFFSSCNYGEILYEQTCFENQNTKIKLHTITFNSDVPLYSHFICMDPKKLIEIFLEYGVNIDDKAKDQNNAITFAFENYNQRIFTMILPNRKIFIDKILVNKKKILENQSEFWKVRPCDYKNIYKQVAKFKHILKFM